MAGVEAARAESVVELEKRLYTLVESAHLLGIHIKTARRLAFMEEFPVEVIRVGRRWFVRKHDLDAFLNGKTS